MEATRSMAMTGDKRIEHSHKLVKVPGYDGLYTAEGFVPDPKKEERIQELIRQEAGRIKSVATKTGSS
jgi:hypothetical protein